MIPIDGPVRENVGLLGSPPFEIPRMVDRDRNLNASISEETRRVRLRRKNVYNAVTAVLFLASRWISVFAAVVLWHAALANYERFGVLSLFVASVAITGAYVAFFVLLERASLRFKRLEPKIASIYDPYFWFHERHWKLAELAGSEAVRRHAVPRRAASCHGHEDRPKGVRLQPLDHRAHAHHSRRSCQPQRRMCSAGSLARGRRVQIRLHPPRQRMLDRAGSLRALWRQHGRPRRARRRFLPDEGGGSRLRIPAGAATRRN